MYYCTSLGPTAPNSTAAFTNWEARSGIQPSATWPIVPRGAMLDTEILDTAMRLTVQCNTELCNSRNFSIGDWNNSGTRARDETLDIT